MSKCKLEIYISYCCAKKLVPLLSKVMCCACNTSEMDVDNDNDTKQCCTEDGCCKLERCCA